MKFKKVFRLFVTELNKDKELYESYKANIAMSYQDCCVWESSRDSRKKRHTIGNRAADHFLKILLKTSA